MFKDIQPRTKIVATIGPASSDSATLKNMIRAGMNVVRINLAHGTLDQNIQRYTKVREVIAEEGSCVGVLVDLPGPKMRTASFGDEPVHLANDAVVNLTVGNECSGSSVIEIDYESLLEDVKSGDVLDIGDGRVKLAVMDIAGDELTARVINGGALTGRPGIHIPAERLRIETPTPTDLKSLEAFVELGVDMVAVSFVCSAQDIRKLGTEPHPHGPLLVAKIETKAAVNNLDDIIDASGAIMVARGDLGYDCSIEDLPHLQKHIIRQCIAKGLPAITATQMLESMVTSFSPTRAEISDVANAVFDGSSALMLSGETAVGVDPARVVHTMRRIASRADEEFDFERWALRVAQLRMIDDTIHDAAAITDAMTMAAWRAASELDISVILAISGTGFTVRSMARFRPRARIIGLSHNPRTIQQISLSWGTTPVLVDDKGSNDEMVSQAIAVAKKLGYVQPGETVAVLAGVDNRSRSANVLRLERVR
ncbi:MAG: pyruvate kinase [Acidimicrobiaceae bacterium]|nr:pyruvate kinase [Acidimicrobiaceae bacterium]